MVSLNGEVGGQSLVCRLSLMSLALALVGCVTPRGLLQQGRVEEAWFEASKARERTRDEIERDILEQERVTVKVEALEVDELARLVGAHLARAVTPQWVLQRITVESHGTFPFLSMELAVGREEKEVPSLAMKPSSLAAATGEHFPETREVSRYGSSLCEAAPLLCLVVLPLAIVTIERKGSSRVAPSEHEVRRAAPGAVRMARLLADDCSTPRRCVRYLLVRRPLAEDEALSVRVRVGLSRRKETHIVSPALFIGAMAPLPAGKTWASRFPLRLTLTSAAGASLRSSWRSMRFCPETQTTTLGPPTTEAACFVDLAPSGSSTWGLTLPPTESPGPQEDALARQWPAAVDAIDVADDAVSEARFELEREDFGVPRASLTQARAMLSKVASLASPDDGRLRVLRLRLDDLERRAHRRTMEGLSAVEHDVLFDHRPGVQRHEPAAATVISVECAGDPCQVDVATRSHGRFFIVFDDGSVSETRTERLKSDAPRLRLVPVARPRGSVPFAVIHREFWSSTMVRLKQ